MNGYIKLYRGLQENLLWLSEPFTKGQAWIDLLLLTNYKPSYLKYRNGEMVKISRGECGYSMETLAKRWKWSRGKVKRYFDLLESEKMIQQKTGSKSTIIKVLKFEMYQERTSNDTSNGHQTDTNKEGKERKEEYINLSLINSSERLGKREREILKSYCKKNNVKNVNAYIKTLVKNGDTQEILEEEKRKEALKQRKSESVNLVQEVVYPEEERKAYERFLAKKQQIRRIK
jgi:hypothetical protein